MHFTEPPSDPHSEYTTRLERFRADWKALESRDLAFGYGKVGAAFTTVAILWAVFGLFALPAWTLALPLALFLALAVAHDGIIRRREQAQFAIAFYEQGLRRLEDRWAGSGNRGDRFADPEHPYAVDLDIFGRGSLFELLCTARTRIGEETLAAWLLQPGAAEAVLRRQKAVEELRPRLDLRERTALLGQEGLKGIDPEALSRWGRNPPHLPPSFTRSAAAVIGGLTLAAGIAWAAGWSWAPFLVLAVSGQILERSQQSRIKKVLREIEKPAADLRRLSGLLGLIEGERFESPMLAELRERVETGGEAASGRIGQLEGLVDRLNARRNPIFGPIAALMLWTTVWSFAIEKWRVENGPYLEAWLAAIGEFEALSSLAGYAYEHPADTFPEIAESGVLFEGTALRHPLLPESQAVANDAALGGTDRVWIISGSNMSGKSTLLRTVGTNAVLGLAGGPARAASLRLSPMQLGASIRTLDSLQGGVSRFYAEILRLRQIVEMADSGPLLFLLDEILHGTNSHDRLIGAEAVVKSLVSKRAIGLVTTHDLALARIVDQPDSRARNVHFQDHLEDGEMRFDYRLQPGVVTKSNALELMRSVGLEV